MAVNKPSIFDFEYSDITEFVNSEREPSYRAEQIWQGLYKNLWQNPASFSSLPASFKNKLSEIYTFSRLTPINQITSKDNQTTKVLFRLPDQKTIETVLMSYNKRRTLCISTQVGCAMGCVFCATGQMGYARNLSSGEIVEQVLFFIRNLAETQQKLTHIVVMGMGEPFHNYDAMMEAIDRLNHKQGLNFGARRFTISTVGIAPAIKKFAGENRQVNLAVSLHAADDQLRSSLLPINRKYPLDELLDACKFYVSTTRRRISFEWALINEVNDDQIQADLLAKKISGILCHVNLILLNPTRSYPGKAGSQSKAVAFKSRLEQHGIPCSIRLRRGIDIRAGCGQLASKESSSSIDL
ncbi:MAG: 23S rRNA (adenine(2503)-C(2))-methyltransferase RlmN [Anaerolineaceae bacterium]